MTTQSVHDRLQDLLNGSSARYRVIDHPAEGKSDIVAAIRGTLPGQGAKAMLLHFKDAEDDFVLAVLPGNRRIDFKKVARIVGKKKATLVPPERAMEITRCVIGAIPPFVFDADIPLIVESALLTNNDEIAFNAGRLDRSIVMDVTDYRRISNCRIADIMREDGA
jgi:Ala-tRNA(Pro) deacylase